MIKQKKDRATERDNILRDDTNLGTGSTPHEINVYIFLVLCARVGIVHATIILRFSDFALIFQAIIILAPLIKINMSKFF